MSFQIQNLLFQVLGDCEIKQKGEYIYYCPFCHHYKRKLCVNIEKRMWHCWVCGSRGRTILSLLRKLHVSKDQIKEVIDELKEEIPTRNTNDDTIVNLSLPSEFIPLYEPSRLPEYKRAIVYLKNRGITTDDIIRYQIGFCRDGQYRNRIIVPSFDEAGQLNFFVGRSYYNVGMSYLAPPLSKNIVGFDFFVNWSMPIYLTEGVFDAMVVKRNAIPLFGKFISKKLREKIIHSGTTDVYLLLDADAIREAVKIAETLMNEGLKVHLVELSDKDPSKLGFEKTQSLIRSTEPLSFTKLMQLKMR